MLNTLTVLKNLCEANMRVSRKTQIFKESVEYLGFVVTRGGAMTDPEGPPDRNDFTNPQTGRRKLCH